MSNPAIVIFDVEGTLIDCVPQTLESWRQVLSEFGHSFRRDELQPYSGMDGGQMLDCLLPALPLDAKKEILKRQGELYRIQHLRAVRSFPDVHQVFAALKKEGSTLAIATTCKHDELAVYDQQMRALRLTDAVVCGDDVEHGKPHPELFRAVLRKLKVADPSDVVALGDTPYDAKAAIALGLEAVGVLTGGFSREVLESAGCTCVLENLHAMVPHLLSTRLNQTTLSASSMRRSGQ